MGTREIKTGKKLWDKIQDKELGKINTDYWKAYENFIPKDKHVQSKAQTYTVEGYNSLVRHYLARMKRKTKCDSKCKIMLEYSLKLLMAKLNNQLTIIE